MKCYDCKWRMICSKNEDDKCGYEKDLMVMSIQCKWMDCDRQCSKCDFKPYEVGERVCLKNDDGVFKVERITHNGIVLRRMAKGECLMYYIKPNDIERI